MGSSRRCTYLDRCCTVGSIVVVDDRPTVRGLVIIRDSDSEQARWRARAVAEQRRLLAAAAAIRHVPHLPHVHAPAVGRRHGRESSLLLHLCDANLIVLRCVFKISRYQYTLRYLQLR